MSEPADQPLPELLRRRAREEPDQPFLQEVDGPATSYGELERLVQRWRRRLTAAGVRPGDYVVSMLPTSTTCVAVWLALARLGAVEVPVNTAHHGSVLAGVLTDSTARVAVVAERWLDRFAPAGNPALPALTVLDDRLEATGEQQPDEPAGRAERAPAEPAPDEPVPEPELPPDEPELAEHDIATVVFTSGTTGRSKGVLIPWRQLRESARWCIPLQDAGPADHWYLPLPMFHVSGKLSLYAAALTGARAILREVFSTSAFWSDVRRFQATTVLLPGSAARYLEAQPARPDDADNPLRSVFVAPFPVDRDAFARRFDVRLTTAFNMTELSCPIVSGWQLGPEGSCGRPRPGVHCRIVDEFDRDVAPGQVGELVVRTDHPWETMAGYLGAPEATVAAWRNLWFHTGDHCRRDQDGFFYFIDRAGDAIRRRGENISSAELEAALSAHPGIAEVAAIGVASQWGEQDVQIFVVPQPGARLTAESVVAFAEAELPRFMVPRYVVIVEDLPRTHTHRVQKARLRNWQGPEPVYDRGR